MSGEHPGTDQLTLLNALRKDIIDEVRGSEDRLGARIDRVDNRVRDMERDGPTKDNCKAHDKKFAAQDDRVSAVESKQAAMEAAQKATSDAKASSLKTMGVVFAGAALATGILQAVIHLTGG